MPKLAECTEVAEVQVIIDDYMDYYNNRRYQWHLAKLSPNEFYKFVTTGRILWISRMPLPRQPSGKNLKSLARRQFI